MFTAIAVGRDHLHRPLGPADPQPGLGGDARPAARRGDGQPDRPDLPLTRARSAAGSWTGSSCRTGRCSTWPTRRSSAAACSWSCSRARAPARRHHPSRPRRGRGRSRTPRRTAAARQPGGERPMSPPGQRRVPVPDGLDGERLDAALARMFGLSRARAAELIGERLGARRRAARGQVRPGARRGVAGRDAAAAGDGAARAPSPCPAWWWCTRTPTSWSWTSRRGSPRTRRPAGPGRPCCRACWPPATRSPPAARPSGRASCTGSTPAPRA